MLSKLLKYDLRSNFKFLAIFYVLAIIFAIITRILFAVNDSLFLTILAYVFNGATIAMIANILINNLMRAWVYFKNNLYGDEGYLMHTLPVPRSNLYASKFLMGLITMVTSSLIIIATMAIAWLTPESFEGLKNMLAPMAEIIDSTAVEIILLTIFVVVLEILVMLFSGYTGIILGHRKLNKRTAWSVFIGFCCYIVIQLVILIGMFILAGVKPEIGDSLFSNERLIPDISALKPVFVQSIILYFILIAINYMLSAKWFKRIDLD